MLASLTIAVLALYLLIAEPLLGRHAHRQPIADLVKNDRSRAIRDLGSQLDTPVARPGMQHKGVLLDPLHPLSIESVELGIFSNGGKESPFLAFFLYAKHIEDIYLFENLVEIMAHLDAEPGEPVRHQR